MTELILQPGKERSAMRRHPWIFAGAVAHLKGRARAGDTVDVFAHDGRPLGRAAFSPHSQIRARLWTFDAEETIDHAFFKRRVAAGVSAVGAAWVIDAEAFLARVAAGEKWDETSRKVTLTPQRYPGLDALLAKSK